MNVQVHLQPRGFTLVELVVTMIVIGIMAVVAIPRMSGIGTFDARGAADQATAYLRFAQKSALAQRRYVQISGLTADPTGATAPTLTVGTTTACGATPLAYPGSFRSPRNVTVTGTDTYCFDTMGGLVTPSGGGNLTFSADSTTVATVTVEAVTGYVHLD